MKLLILLSTFLFLSINAYAESTIIGKWKDKNDQTNIKIEFKSNNDFIYIIHWEDKGEVKTRNTYGVWEISDWNVVKSGKNVDTCNLTIYANSEECCFQYKFISNNLILSNKVKGDYIGPMCDNRVLTRENKYSTGRDLLAE